MNTIQQQEIKGDIARAICRAFFSTPPQCPIVMMQAGDNGVCITCHDSGQSKELTAEGNGRLTFKITGNSEQRVFTLYADGSARATVQPFSPIMGLTGVRSSVQLANTDSEIQKIRDVASHILPLVRPLIWNHDQSEKPPLDLDKIIKG